MVVSIVCLLFFLSIFCSLTCSKSRYEQPLLIILTILLIFVASFRDGADHDYTTYIEYYNTITAGFSYSVEPSFHLIAKVVKYIFFDEVLIMFAIYAILGIGLKAYGIYQLTEFRFLSIVTYISFYFLMHDLTQMRAGIASALLLLCVKPLYERKYVLFCILVTVASLFHYSALALIPLAFINPYSLQKKIYLFLIPIGYALCFVHLDVTGLLYLIPVADIQSKIQAYLYLQSYSDDVEMPNIFNALFLIRCTVATFLVFYADLLFASNKYVYILIKIYVWGLFSFLIFSSVAGFAFRISELYGIVEIILLPYITIAFVQKKLAYIFPIMISTFILYIELFYVKLLSLS